MVYNCQNEVTMKPNFINNPIICSNFAVDESMQKPMGRTMMYRLLVACILMLLPTVAGAYDFIADGIYYDLVDGHAVVTHNGQTNCYSGDVVIPETVTHDGTTYPVTAIGDYAFKGSTGLIHVTIPEGITTIGYSAFGDCMGLESVTIPESVASIGEYAFACCYSLRELVYNAVNCEDFGWSGTPFVYSGIENIIIGDNVRRIPDLFVYELESLKTVSIGKSVTSIGMSAFDECVGLTSVHIKDLAAWCTISYHDWTSNPLYYARRLFLNGEEIKDLVIPSSVTSISSFAFLSCSHLTTVTIPNTVTSIGDYAFEDCPSLVKATIGNGVTRMGTKIFNYCQNLDNVTCIAGRPPVFTESGLFYDLGYYADATLHVLSESVTAYQSATYWQDFSLINGDAIFYLLGDVNGDSEINVADVNNVIDIIINGGSSGGHSRVPSPYGNGWAINGDVNGDSEVNIADINVIINHILGSQ